MTRLTALALTLVAAPAGVFAQSAVETDIAPPAAVAPAQPFAATGGSWTGGYAGLQLGYADVDATGGADGDDALFGVHGGYRYDFGTFVLGGEIDYDTADIDLNGAATVDSVARLKLQLGYDFGPVLGYFTAGGADVDTSLGSDTGDFYGIGFAYQIDERYTFGAELLEHSFDNIGGTGVAADATTLTVRGSIRF
ncbi:outer membrane protein [Tateyamaria sp. SN6-1]|uniref:outer membrane protein n=1 Tax=Tateyamaria sp. SN6-1 TaxID=3092148 RepID=UPI0039F4DE6C